MKKTIKLVFDRETLSEYEKYYFSKYPRRKTSPIKQPYHESINKWMIMKRAAMNALKQRWKDFMVWLVSHQGYSNLRIDKCELEFITYYPTTAPHDTDNSVPKFILDGLKDSGFIVDDDSKHVTKLTLQCDVDKERPRTEIITIIKE